MGMRDDLLELGNWAILIHAADRKLRSLTIPETEESVHSAVCGLPSSFRRLFIVIVSDGKGLSCKQIFMRYYLIVLVDDGMVALFELL